MNKYIKSIVLSVFFLFSMIGIKNSYAQGSGRYLIAIKDFHHVNLWEYDGKKMRLKQKLDLNLQKLLSMKETCILLNKCWHDVAFSVNGEYLAVLTDVFIQIWKRETSGQYKFSKSISNTVGIKQLCFNDKDKLFGLISLMRLKLVHIKENGEFHNLTIAMEEVINEIKEVPGNFKKTISECSCDRQQMEVECEMFELLKRKSPVLKFCHEKEFRYKTVLKGRMLLIAFGSIAIKNNWGVPVLNLLLKDIKTGKEISEFKIKGYSVDFTEIPYDFCWVETFRNRLFEKEKNDRLSDVTVYTGGIVKLNSNSLFDKSIVSRSEPLIPRKTYKRTEKKVDKKVKSKFEKLRSRFENNTNTFSKMKTRRPLIPRKTYKTIEKRDDKKVKSKFEDIRNRFEKGFRK